jgi:hypothetical protein
VDAPAQHGTARHGFRYGFATAFRGVAMENPPAQFAYVEVAMCQRRNKIKEINAIQSLLKHFQPK